MGGERGTLVPVPLLQSVGSPAEAAVEAIVITCAGRTFFAGADISEFVGLSKEQGMAMAQKGQDLFFKIENCPKPIIAAINGLADEDLKDSLRDWLEILNLLGLVIPDINLSLGLSGIMDLYTQWKFRQTMTNLVEDMAISQRIMATAQMGTSGHSLYDALQEPAEALLLPAGWLGRAIWLWNRVKPSEVPAWVGWLTDNLPGPFVSMNERHSTGCQAEKAPARSVKSVGY